MNYLRLVRYKNLLIIIATMFIIRYGIINAFMPLQLTFVGFCLLVLATVCISAAGYIINDYFDVNADMMNRPDTVIIGKSINRRNAIILHWVLNIIGCICGFLVSYGVGRPSYTFVFMFIAGILWFYSTTFSREPIVGNIVVAVLVAVVPLIETLYEVLPLLSMPIEFLADMHIKFEDILMWSLGYALFAFLLTLLREMVKDIEDVEGDRSYGRNTLPIAYGISIARYATIGVAIIILAAIIFVQVVKLHDVYSLIYLNVLISAPMLYVIVRLCKAEDAQDYSHVSLILKITMLLGLLYLFPYVF